jgi:hypothetical protein
MQNQARQIAAWHSALGRHRLAAIIENDKACTNVGKLLPTGLESLGSKPRQSIIYLYGE